MGKNKSPGDQTVTQTNLPEYAEPYVTRLFSRAETESQRRYQPYGGERIAGLDPATSAGWGTIESMGPEITGMDTAMGATGQAMTGAQGIASMANPFSAYQFGPAGSYLGGTVQQYMSPYMQNVVDVQKARAQLDFDRAQSGRDAAAVQAGAFGGGRDAVVNALAQEDLARRMDEIQATGLQDAFTQGAGLFDSDRAARMATEAAQAGELGRTQAGALDWGRMGLAGYQLSSDLAGQMAQLGGLEREAALQYADALGQVGEDRRSFDQQFLDQDYQDFLAQQAYPYEQLSRYSAILRGMPMPTTTTTTQFTQANPFKDIMGLGLSALGLSQGLG